jgi:hypothetical protein
MTLCENVYDYGPGFRAAISIFAYRMLVHTLNTVACQAHSVFSSILASQIH